jgi:purine nucleoside phosphorylase
LSKNKIRLSLVEIAGHHKTHFNLCGPGNTKKRIGMVKIGIIGGSGLDDPRLLEDTREVQVSTSYGDPSFQLSIGSIHGRKVAILARHGKRHTLSKKVAGYFIPKT